MLATFVIALLGLWFLLTLLYQCFIPTWQRYTWRWDLFRLLPAFRLFATVPRDLRLDYRHQLAGGTMTEWQVVLLYSRYASYHALWHPGYLQPHVLSSLTANLATFCEVHPAAEEPRLQRQLDYGGIVHYLRQVPTEAAATGLQFRIVAAGPGAHGQSERLLFCSAFQSV